MQYTHCPICYEELELRATTPCMDCGAYPEELEHLKEGKHTYAELEIVFGLKLILCNFCQVDFSSYKPETWGFADNRRIDYSNMTFQRTIKPKISKTKFCSNCGHSLSFLKFLIKIKEIAQQ